MVSGFIALLLALILKQILNMFFILLFYARMLSVLRYIRGIFILVTAILEIAAAFMLSSEIHVGTETIIILIALMELLTSILFVPIDYNKCRRGRRHYMYERRRHQALEHLEQPNVVVDV